jgi:uncharacterized protein (DUF2267 family)
MLMVLDFEKYATKGNEFIRLVALELEVPRDMAGRITRSVFHAIRNRITHQESFQLIAQLPMAIKAVYVDGWSYQQSSTRLRHIVDLLNEIREEDGKLSGYDFGDNANAVRALKAVLNSTASFVSTGEMKDILGTLPHEIRDILQKDILKTPVKESKV